MTLYLLLSNLFLWIFAAGHTLFADHRFKAKASPIMGRFFHWYRLIYNLFSLVAAAIFFMLFLPGDQVLTQIPLPWSIGLHLVQAVGMGLIVWILVVCFDPWEFLGLRQLTRNTADQAPPLKTDGPFALCRHPLYLGALLATGCNPRISVLGLSMTAFVLLYAVLGSIPEERKLVADYGQPYRDYQAKTKRLIPGLF